MADFRQSMPFTATLLLLKPSYKNVGGIRSKIVPALSSGEAINASFRSFGGTETTVDGIYSITDTAEVTTWYRPDITSDCLVAFATGETYEIINTPENINMRNQYLKFKVKRIKGGA